MIQLIAEEINTHLYNTFDKEMSLPRKSPHIKYEQKTNKRR